MQPGRILVYTLMAASVVPQLRGADKPVKAIASQGISLSSSGRNYALPIYVSNGNLSQSQPSITRALIVFHGKLRNAETYNQSGLEAIKRAGSAAQGTLLITPQFLEQVDADAYRLPNHILRWANEDWVSGANAANASLSTYDAIDAILDSLGNRRLFPNLKIVVLAGHSAGGQLLQRYAVVGRAGDLLAKAGIRVRYVIANPSSYLYFSPERPVLKPQAEFTFEVPEQKCSGNYNRWKYGPINPPPYAASADFSAFESRYVQREVVYLLGDKDIDPNHPELDKSCAGEDEGPYRFFRGNAYLRYLQLRHPELATVTAAQQLWAVPGVGHDGEKMLNSACGLAALFDAGRCETRILEPKP